jgi:regulator of protease activity HflC (stomatin/prohibitin superfamily)
VDEVTRPVGVKVTHVEIEDVERPDSMRRAKVIHALGEFEAVAEVLEAYPAAMQLRVLSTMAEVATERNSNYLPAAHRADAPLSTPCAPSSISKRH